MANSYDLIVLGSGPGGYVAAIRASQLGMKTAIVERESLGGICLNWGCIPTKALLRSGEILHHMKHAEKFGLKADGVGMDIDKVVARSRGVAKQLNQGVTGLMKKNKIDVHMGTGHIDGVGKLSVTDDKGKKTQLTAKNIIVATGARARDLPFAETDGDKIWTYRHAMVPKEMPKDLLVIGSGAIGIEFASFYNDMGANVTVVEMLDRIVPVEDKDISAELQKSLKKQGMNIMAGAGVESLSATKKGVTAKIKDAKGKVEEKTFSHCIVAIGIVPNTENIGIDKLGVKTTKGHVDTDAMCRTNVKGIWAIGDVTAPPWLAHKASHEGIICVEAIAQEAGNKDVHPHAMDVKNIPGCTYCHPQVASVGLTEEKAKEAGHKVKVGKFPFIGNGKAIALGETEGFIKTVFDAETGELLGAHMIGAEVTELIQGYTVGKQGELVEEDFMNAVFPHPTLSEMMHESVLAAYGRVLHI
ncbi:dihydrolipoyl dehydrogenase [Sphingomicrobium clamense]|uniref:Dihydrolipoyl dehydrogenase n=1 Tax=Sphingomicrobium clamense TaxID=2851013 RepID=A0ABS6V4I0_9SPHN|nr:dihydrolipoyl dehydrogenase [Sphingomicrobium sp. B8]